VVVLAFVLFTVFIVVPVLELAVIVEVSRHLGLGNTLALLIVVSLAGAWVVRHQGVATLRRIRAALDAGRLPTPDLVDGAAILLAGAFLLTPGFITDALGLLLLLGPTRGLIRRLLRRFLVGRLAVREIQFRRPRDGQAGPPGGPLPPGELPPG